MTRNPPFHTVLLNLENTVLDECFSRFEVRV
jgi:hypothetical protein